MGHPLHSPVSPWQLWRKHWKSCSCLCPGGPPYISAALAPWKFPIKSTSGLLLGIQSDAISRRECLGCSPAYAHPFPSSLHALFLEHDRLCTHHFHTLLMYLLSLQLSSIQFCCTLGICKLDKSNTVPSMGLPYPVSPFFWKLL